MQFAVIRKSVDVLREILHHSVIESSEITKLRGLARRLNRQNILKNILTPEKEGEAQSEDILQDGEIVDTGIEPRT